MDHKIDKSAHHSPEKQENHHHSSSRDQEAEEDHQEQSFCEYEEIVAKSPMPEIVHQNQTIFEH